MEFTNPDDLSITNLLRAHTRVTVVGLSPKASRPSYKVAKAMQGFGYQIVPVRPATDEVLGEPAYADLAGVEGDLGIVNVFRSAEHVAPIVDDCLARGATALWLQEGVVAPEQAARAREAGMTVVMDRCIWKEYERLGIEEL